MVNDSNNVELIRWSDAGDSFFGAFHLHYHLHTNLTFLSTVLDRGRFEEVLGRWFKHRHFSAFVCQLKLYGFYKIPHSQQGGLKSDTEAEIWNFAHANFHRGQPDLLCLIKRKKQAPQYGDEASIDLPGGMTFGGWPSC